MNPPVSGIPACASRKKMSSAAEHRAAERQAAVAVDRVVVVALRAISTVTHRERAERP